MTANQARKESHARKEVKAEGDGLQI